jgi:hypothetical protein
MRRSSGIEVADHRAALERAWCDQRPRRDEQRLGAGLPAAAGPMSASCGSIDTALLRR